MNYTSFQDQQFHCGAYSINPDYVEKVQLFIGILATFDYKSLHDAWGYFFCFSSELNCTNGQQS